MSKHITQIGQYIYTATAHKEESLHIVADKYATVSILILINNT